MLQRLGWQPESLSQVKYRHNSSPTIDHSFDSDRRSGQKHDGYGADNLLDLGSGQPEAASTDLENQELPRLRFRGLVHRPGLYFVMSAVLEAIIRHQLRRPQPFSGFDPCTTYSEGALSPVFTVILPKPTVLISLAHSEGWGYTGEGHWAQGSRVASRRRVPC